MFKIHEVRELIKLIDQSTIKEFEIELDGAKMSIKKSGGAVVETGVSLQAEPVVVASPAPVAVQAPVATAPVAQAVAKEEAAQAPAKPAVDDATLHKIVSPMVGTFYSSPEPSAPAYVKPGDRVTAAKVVCIVEAMKLFNEIEAEVNGEIVEVLVENGQLVEYGQPLFLVRV